METHTPESTFCAFRGVFRFRESVLPIEMTAKLWYTFRDEGESGRKNSQAGKPSGKDERQ